jgi:hypothetical protein
MLPFYKLKVPDELTAAIFNAILKLSIKIHDKETWCLITL